MSTNTNPLGELHLVEKAGYIPDSQEIAELAEIERLISECPHSHKLQDLDPEDGCIHCGYYAK